MVQSSQQLGITGAFHPYTTTFLGETYPYTWSQKWNLFEAVAVRTDEAFQSLAERDAKGLKSSFEQEPVYRTNGLILETEASAEQILDLVLERLKSHLPSKSVVATTTLDLQPELSLLQAGHRSELIEQSRLRDLLTK